MRSAVAHPIGLVAAVPSSWTACSGVESAHKPDGDSLRAVVPIKFSRGPQFDIKRRRIDEAIKSWITSERIWCLLVALPSRIWSHGFPVRITALQLLRACRAHRFTLVIENAASITLLSSRPLVRK